MPFVYLFVLILLLTALVRQRRPSINRDWQPELAKQTRGVVEGDSLTLYDVRNARYTAPASLTTWYGRRASMT